MISITPKLKDAILEVLCTQCKPENTSNITNVNDFLKEIDTNFDTLNAILSQFQRLGFIDDLNSRRVAIFFILRVEAIDFYNRGGFVAQEELLKKNIEKLLLEIEDLKPSIPEKAERIANISNAIISALGLFTQNL